jgi:bacterioferritin-associated ferredoxin
MIVCVCHRVSDRDIHHHAKQGCISFDELQMETGVATCCGRCETCAREVFDDAHQAHTGRGAQRVIPIEVAMPA